MNCTEKNAASFKITQMPEKGYGKRFGLSAKLKVTNFLVKCKTRPVDGKSSQLADK